MHLPLGGRWSSKLGAELSQLFQVEMRGVCCHLQTVWGTANKWEGAGRRVGRLCLNVVFPRSTD